MGQRVSSCTHPSFACSNYGDYEKLKSEKDSIVQKKNKSQKEDSIVQKKNIKHFPSELRKQIKQSFQLINKTDNYIAFQVMGTNPKKCRVNSNIGIRVNFNIGILLPRSTCDIIVTMLAQEEAPLNVQCKDHFVFQTIFVRPGPTTKDITPKMFEKNSGYNVEELIIPVFYVPRPKQSINNRLLEHVSLQIRWKYEMEGVSYSYLFLGEKN